LCINSALILWQQAGRREMRIPLKASIEPNPVTKAQHQNRIPRKRPHASGTVRCVWRLIKNCSATPFRQREPNITILISLCEWCLFCKHPYGYRKTGD
jgi:hypothetical protein